MLDNYDTNLHLKHAEHLAGCCTVAVIKEGGGRKRGIKHRLLQAAEDGHGRLLASGSQHMWENIRVYIDTRAPLKSVQNESPDEIISLVFTPRRVFEESPLNFYSKFKSVMLFYLLFLAVICPINKRGCLRMR